VKFDIFSLGVVLLEIVSGPQGRTILARMPPQEFIGHVRTLLFHGQWLGFHKHGTLFTFVHSFSPATCAFRLQHRFKKNGGKGWRQHSVDPY
jgi:hypothetical protein